MRASQVHREIERAKHRANMYVILTTVLVTAGIVGGSVLLASSSLLGLFGVALVCLGIGCAATSDRYERRARCLTNEFIRCR